MNSLSLLRDALKTGLSSVPSGVGVPACGIFAAFFLSVWFLTGNLGVGTNPDSSSYLSIAANLLEELSYRSHYQETSAHFPPLYPMMIAATSVATSRDVRHGAPRLLAAVFFGLAGVLTWAVLRAGSASPAASLTGCSLVLFQPAIALYSISALTELPSLVCTIAGWLLFHFAVSRGSRRFLIASAIAFAFAILIRYANVVWPCVASFHLLLRHSPSLFIRFRGAILYGLLAIGPALAWIATWNWLGDAPARVIAWHPVSPDTLLQGLETLGSTIGLVCGWAGAGLAIALLGLSLYLWLDHRRNAGPGTSFAAVGLVPTLAQHALAYVGFLLLSISLLDRATPLDERILLPVIWMVPIIGIVAIETATTRRPRLRSASLAIIGLLSLGQLLWLWTPRASPWQRDGVGLSHFSVRYDKTLGILRGKKLEEIEAIYSNVPWTVYLTAGVDAWLLPSAEDYTSGARNADYDVQLARIVKRAAAGEVLVVMDCSYRDSHYLPPTTRFFHDAGLALVAGTEGERFLIFGADHVRAPRSNDSPPAP